MPDAICAQQLDSLANVAGVSGFSSVNCNIQALGFGPLKDLGKTRC